MNDLISVIIPIYNGERFINRCIDSVLAQTYKNLEIILVDDGSKDNSSTICDQYALKDSRIKVIHKKNEGVAAARNKGIQEANGQYISFVDSDDWIEEDAINTLHLTLEQNKVDVVRGNYYIENTNGMTKNGNVQQFGDKNIEYADIKIRNELMLNILSGKFLCYVWLLLIKKSVLNNNNLFFKEDISLMEDTIFYVELINTKCSIYILNKSIYHYEDNKNSATKSIEKILKNIYTILDVNVIITSILIKSEYSDYIYEVSLNNKHFNMIMNLFFKLYIKQIYSKKDLKQEIVKISKNEIFCKIINKTNGKDMPIHLKIQYYLMKNKRFNELLVYYRMRKIIVKIRDMILKKKFV